MPAILRSRLLLGLVITLCGHGMLVCLWVLSIIRRQPFWAIYDVPHLLLYLLLAAGAWVLFSHPQGGRKARDRLLVAGILFGAQAFRLALVVLGGDPRWTPVWLGALLIAAGYLILSDGLRALAAHQEWPTRARQARWMLGWCLFMVVLFLLLDNLKGVRPGMGDETTAYVFQTLAFISMLSTIGFWMGYGVLLGKFVQSCLEDG